MKTISFQNDDNLPVVVSAEGIRSIEFTCPLLSTRLTIYYSNGDRFSINVKPGDVEHLTTLLKQLMETSES